MSLGIRLRSAIGWTTIGRLSSGVIQAGSIALLARNSEPSEYGTAAAVLGVLVVLVSAGDLGTSGAMLRERARGEAERHGTERRLTTTNLRLAVLIGCVAAVGLTGTGFLTHSRDLLLLAPLGIWLLYDRKLEMLGLLAMADGDARVSAASLTVRRLSHLGLFALLLVVLPVPALLSYSTSCAVSAVAVWLWLSRRVPCRTGPTGTADMRASIRDGLPFWWNSFGAQLRQLDTAVLAWATMPAVVAVYSLPARLITPIRILPTSVAMVLLPALVRSNGVIDGRTRRVLAQSGAATAVLFGALFVAAGPIVTLIGGARYRDAAGPLRVLVVGLLFAAVTSSLNSVLQARSRERTVGRISMGTGLLALALVAAGGSVDGATGAAIGLSSTYAVQLAILLVVVRRAGQSTEERVYS